MKAFLSYKIEDRDVAAQICDFFESIRISAFMAHEHIRAAQNWNRVILSEIGDADIFVAILSKGYQESVFCLQESGIAVYRIPDLTIIPVSLDGTNPPGFMGPIQAKRINRNLFNPGPFFDGLAERDRDYAVSLMIG